MATLISKVEISTTAISEVNLALSERCPITGSTLSSFTPMRLRPDAGDN
jgi:hypothetical protein